MQKEAVGTYPECRTFISRVKPVRTQSHLLNSCIILSVNVTSHVFKKKWTAGFNLFSLLSFEMHTINILAKIH